MWNWNEIARSFDFRNDAKPKTPTVSRLLIYIKALSKRQKTIKFPALALGIAETQRSWYMSKSSCLLKIYGITVKSYISQTTIYLCLSNMNTVYSTIFIPQSTFINFINSFRFDTNFNFLLYRLIINNTSEI